MRRRPPLLLATGALLGLALVAGCSGDQESVSDGRSPDEVMALAKTTLDETSGVSISLETTDLPAGVTGVTEASGVGTHPPAFDGSLTVVLAGTALNVPVIAVDDKVYAQIPLTPGWSDVDPAEYGAPDPSTLMSPDTGFSALLPATEDLEEGESVRGGEDNKEVLTEFTGTVPDDAVRNILPGAEGDFDATYTITADGELREAVLRGVFYPDTESMTYTIGFEDYGTEKKITAP
ncbi:LppX_LprAFG lipoprotein [Nocardioides sp.]|uniref:LppX_LprAFG lipoprotein n=1 Tax=Nocardioides sp. TaxID=35761 RepID=UPI002D8096A6|nr:LppX_LprAFG lipoprotein [Nocardioides sp.]HET8960823.1 LppX_LprAFG lipoprotein [Nocardioides sp.]